MKRLVVLDTNCLVQMLSVHSPYVRHGRRFVKENTNCV